MISSVHLSPTRSSARASGDHWSYGWRLGGGTGGMVDLRWIRRFQRQGQNRPPDGVTVGLVIRLRHGCEHHRGRSSGPARTVASFSGPRRSFGHRANVAGARSETGRSESDGRTRSISPRAGRRGGSAPAGGRSERTREFFFDLACPFTYLAAERIERAFDDVVWTPATARAALHRGHAAAVRHTARGARRGAAAPAGLAGAVPRRRVRRDARRRPTRPSAGAARRSCSRPRGSRSAAASTSTIPRSWPRRPRRRG